MEGSKLLSELDYMFRDLGSMKLILREFYQQYKRKTVVIEDFKRVIEEESGIDMNEIFVVTCLKKMKVASIQTQRVLVS